MSKEEIPGATEVKIPYNKLGGHVVWKVLAEGEEIEEDCRPSEGSTLRRTLASCSSKHPSAMIWYR